MSASVNLCSHALIRIPQHVLLQEPAKQGRLFGLLWNYAMRKLEEQQPEGAQRFFSACLAVARGPSLEVAGRGACTWQAQALYSKALCFAQMSQFGRQVHLGGGWHACAGGLLPGRRRCGGA